MKGSIRARQPQYPALVLSLVVSIGMACSRWPPAVQSVAQIESLPISQSDIRGIGIGDHELQLIADRFQGLNYLYLNSSSHVSDFGISKLSKSAKLHQVVIENGQNLTDQSIAVLAGLPAIHELIITGAPRLTDASFTYLGRNSNLDLIHLLNCPQLSPAAKSKFIAAHPKCQILF